MSSPTQRTSTNGNKDQLGVKVQRSYFRIVVLHYTTGERIGKNPRREGVHAGEEEDGGDEGVEEESHHHRLVFVLFEEFQSDTQTEDEVGELRDDHHHHSSDEPGFILLLRLVFHQCIDGFQTKNTEELPHKRDDENVL